MMLLKDNHQQMIPSDQNPSPCYPQTSQPRIRDGEEEEEVDLCNESDTTSLLPSFSLRDYVWSNRGKGIANHWPFSSKHLHLCFKHGAGNDVLPPFQGLDSTGKDQLSSKTDVQNIDLVESRELIESKKGKEVRSTSQEVENFGDTLESSYPTELPVCKGKMPPKVCPVCKTFSSLSNNALNAHIDRCLSSESTSKQKENLTVAKHKMKARKKRLLANIYATSLEWTLEDLDRRNGTNWAVQGSIQYDIDEKGPSSSYVNSEDDRDGDDVHVDSNSDGTELHNLSRFDCLQSILKREEKLKHPKHLFSRLRSYTHMRNGYFLEVNDSRRSNNKDGSPSDRLKQWIGSKRTVARKKINLKCNEFHNHHHSPRLRKRDRYTLIDSVIHHGKKKYLFEQSRKDNRSLDDDSCLDPSSISENRASSQHNKSPPFSTRTQVDATIRDSSDALLLESDNHRADISFHDRAISDVEVSVAGEAFMIFGKSVESGNASGSNGVKDYDKGYYSTFTSGDYVVDVDPILIPGPPGSYLPSPGHTGSEEIQGNSSLMACKARSSHGEFELIDVHSLDSPISSRLDLNLDNSMLFENTCGGLGSRDSLDKKCRLLHGSNSSTLVNATTEVAQNSRPMLRLMGKNLTIVNDGDEHPSLKMSGNFGMTDLRPNPSGGVTTLYDVSQAQYFPSFNLCRGWQGSNARTIEFQKVERKFE